MSRAAGQVVGARELRRTLKGLGDDLQDFTDVHAAIASLIGTEAARRVPNTSGRSTGRTAASMRPTKAKASASIKFGGARLPYTGAVHWGTGPRAGKPGPHNIKASLFATKAASDLEPVWVPMYETAVDQMLDKVKGAPA